MRFPKVNSSQGKVLYALALYSYQTASEINELTFYFSAQARISELYTKFSIPILKRKINFIKPSGEIVQVMSYALDTKLIDPKKLANFIKSAQAIYGVL